MSIPAIVTAAATALATVLAQKGLDKTADGLVAPVAERVKDTLGKTFNAGRHATIRRALEGAHQDVLDRYATNEERSEVRQSLDRLMNSDAGLLIDEFREQVQQIYTSPSTSADPANALACTYRKVTSLKELIQGNVPSEETLTTIFNDFLVAFRERLLREPDFAPLREYFQLAEERQQTALLETIASNTTPKAAPADDLVEIAQRYRDFLINKLKDHTLRGFAPRVSGRELSLPLAKIFLPLQSVEGRPALAQYALEDLRRQAASEVDGEMDWLRRHEEIEKRFAQLAARQAAQRPVSLADLLKEPRAVLLGDPGTGKTTVTRYITYALAADDTTHTGAAPHGRVPVLVRIATYAKVYESDRTLHLVDYITRELTPQPEFGRFLAAALAAGTCFIILDGLDEVTDPALRMEITDRIQEMVANDRGNQFLVTSRIVGYEVSPLTREFKHATLQELTPADRERFVQLWYDAIMAEVTDSTHREGAEELIDAFRTKPQIARMAANPLLLTIMVLMHWRGTKLPGRRVQVYENATDTLIEYWTQQRGVELDAEDIKSILGPIAHYILSSNVGGVIGHHDLLPRFFEGIVEQRGCSQAEAKRVGRELLKNLNEQSGLFLERGLDENHQPVYGFLHQTFGEYLAAFYLSRQFISGEFELAHYIHRSVWYEPMLLMAGDLALRSPTHAEQLIRQILDFSEPFGETLQRNTLLAADCLADDVQIKPALRDLVLEKLTHLLQHEAPQVQAAALERYERLAVTRYREAAISRIKHIYPLDADGVQQTHSAKVQFNIATALIYLRDRAAAEPLLQELDKRQNYEISAYEVQQLRFQTWPEQAGAYLLALQRRQGLHFYLEVGFELANSTIGPINSGLAYEVLGEAGLRNLVEGLRRQMTDKRSQSSLQWLAALISEAPALELLLDLMAEDVDAEIRSFAAIRLLESSHRTQAVAVLQELSDKHPQHAPLIAKAFVRVRETHALNLQVLREAAFLTTDDATEQAIATLFEMGDHQFACAATLHWLARPDQIGDKLLWALAEHLLSQGYTGVGIHAATWLALKPGYEYRLRACEALLEAGNVEAAIPLLQFLAYECHDRTSLQACQRLLMLKEANRVVPLLATVVQRSSPDVRYQACLALALGSQSQIGDESLQITRDVLKGSIWRERTDAYRAALKTFCTGALVALDANSGGDEQTRQMQGLARVRLLQLADPINDYARSSNLFTCSWPAMSTAAASFVLETGNVLDVRHRLTDLLREAEWSLSVLSRREVVWMLAQTIDPGMVDVFIQILGDEDEEVRSTAARALGGLGDPAALGPLVRALTDKNAEVRRAVAEALGWLGDATALEPLVYALGDEDNFVRYYVVEALGRLGDPAALEPLVRVLTDEDNFVQSAVFNALVVLGGPATLEPLVRVLSDENSTVGRAVVSVLSASGDPVALEPLVRTLSDENSAVRSAAVEALGWLGNPAALEPLVRALSDENSAVRSAAAKAIGKLGNPAALEPLVRVLSDENSAVRSAAVEAIGKLGNPAALEPLVRALSDENSAVQANAAWALGTLGNPAALEPLVHALTDEDAIVRRVVATALGELGDPTALEPLVGALSDEDALVRSAAAETLGRLGDPAALEPLVRLLADDDTGICSVAAEALGAIGDSAAVRPLQRALWYQQWGAQEAARSLAKLKSQQSLDLLIAMSFSISRYSAAIYATALIQLSLDASLPVLDWYRKRFPKESWPQRLQGLAQWRVGNIEGALDHLKAALEREDNSTNLLALAHFYLEHDDFAMAKELVHRAAHKGRWDAPTLLSQAVILWQDNAPSEALEKLRQAKQQDSHMVNVQDLAFDHFWGPRALASLEAMMAGRA